MYEVPTDTYQDTQQLNVNVQPNTSAPIVAYEGNQYQWVSVPRNIALMIGVPSLLVIGAIAMRSTAITTDQVIKVAPLQNNLAPSTQQVNQVILENSKASLSDIKIATDLKIEEVTKAMLNERSQAILIEANRQLTIPPDPKNKEASCFRSPYQQACFISVFIPEQQKRYEMAALSRDWTKANHALFEIKAARIALDGSQPVQFTPNITSAAIIKEMEARVSILQQSDNAIASEMYGGKQ
jgi:hypothetical protein